MNAQAGDSVLVSRFQTEALQFPCGYDMQIILCSGMMAASNNDISAVCRCVRNDDSRAFR